MAFDLGAIAERLRAAGLGVLLPLTLSPRQINDRLLQEFVHSSSLPERDDAIMVTSGDERMNKTSEVPSAQQDGFSASVQILPLPPGLYLFSVKSEQPVHRRTDGQLQLAGPARRSRSRRGLRPGRIRGGPEHQRCLAVRARGSAGHQGQGGRRHDGAHLGPRRRRRSALDQGRTSGHAHRCVRFGGGRSVGSCGCSGGSGRHGQALGDRQNERGWGRRAADRSSRPTSARAGI